MRTICTGETDAILAYGDPESEENLICIDYINEALTENKYCVYYVSSNGTMIDTVGGLSIQEALTELVERIYFMEGTTQNLRK